MNSLLGKPVEEERDESVDYSFVGKRKEIHMSMFSSSPVGVEYST